MNYAEAEEYINQIPRFSKVKSEENVDEILALFGHPEKSSLISMWPEPMEKDLSVRFWTVCSGWQARRRGSLRHRI